jgi:hypothetical protein
MIKHNKSNESLAESISIDKSPWRYVVHLYVRKIYPIVEIFKSKTLFHEKLLIVFANIRV